MSMDKNSQIELAWAEHTKTKLKKSFFLWSMIPGLKSRLCAEQNHRCCFCGTRFEDEGERVATFEHVVPLKRGGKDHVSNLVMSCYKCNYERGNNLIWPKLGDEEDPDIEVFFDIDLYATDMKKEQRRRGRKKINKQLFFANSNLGRLRA